MTGSMERRLTERRRLERRGADGSGLRPELFLGDGWQTSADIIGYAVEAVDGAVGRVADFRVEEDSFVITEIVAVTRRLWPGQRRVLVPVNAIDRIDPQGRTIYVDASRGELARWSKGRA